MAPRKYYQIRKNFLADWEFKEEDSVFVIKSDTDKQRLIKFAESICKTHESELIIRDENGRIEDKKFFNID